jgi:hypothetical protein
MYYNGGLTAYPTDDCYAYGPSHWIIKVIVDENSSSTNQYSAISNYISVYPNPANTYATIAIRRISTTTNTQLILTDIAGRIILSQQANNGNNYMSTVGFENGVYFISFTNDNKIIANKKLVVIR